MATVNAPTVQDVLDTLYEAINGEQPNSEVDECDEDAGCNSFAITDHNLQGEVLVLDCEKKVTITKKFKVTVGVVEVVDEA